MFDFLFTEPVLTSIIISIFLAPGISVLFLLWKKTVVMPGLKPRRWLGKTVGSALLLCGVVLFLLTVLVVFAHHQNAFYRWLFVVVAGILIMTTLYTFISYKMAFGVFTAIGGKIEPRTYSETGEKVKKDKKDRENKVHR